MPHPRGGLDPAGGRGTTNFPPQHGVGAVLFFLFNCLWTCSCFHQPGIQRLLEVKLLQEHRFDSSFPPTTYLKTKGCQSLLFKTVTSHRREEGGGRERPVLLMSFLHCELAAECSHFGSGCSSPSRFPTPELSL